MQRIRVERQSWNLTQDHHQQSHLHVPDLNLSAWGCHNSNHVHHVDTIKHNTEEDTVEMCQKFFADLLLYIAQQYCDLE